MGGRLGLKIEQQIKRSWLHKVISASIVFVVFAAALLRAYSRVSPDFSVFYHAWGLVWNGHGNRIYQEGPDRYLYSPGFAWLLAPLGGLSFDLAFGIWCLLKVFGLLFVSKWMVSLIEGESNRKGVELAESSVHWLSVALGIAFIARPLLIDFEYGQVNVFILTVVVLSIATHLDSRTSLFKISASWFLLGWLAVAKIFPGPILLLPWFLPLRNSEKKLNFARGFSLLGVSVSLFAPVISQGWRGALRLLFDWKDALISRGFPVESHNQSFLAFVYHFLSGHPTFVLSQNGREIAFGWAFLTPAQLTLVGSAWAFLSMGWLLAWLTRGPGNQSARWMAVLTALLVIPSHLVWKPYFLMALPLAIFGASQLLIQKKRGRDWFVFFVLFAAVNLTSFDFVGSAWGPFFEASSTFLVAHLALMVWVISELSPNEKSKI